MTPDECFAKAADFLDAMPDEKGVAVAREWRQLGEAIYSTKR